MDPMLLVAEHGSLVALLLYFAYREGWPFVRDRLWPTYAASQASERAAQQRLTERLFTLIEENTRAATGLQLTLQHIANQLTQQTQALADLNEDVAGLFAHVGKARPSRSRKAAEGTPPPGA